MQKPTEKTANKDINFIIWVDNREQTPYRFMKYDAKTEKIALPTGDYSLPGFQDKIAIERKTINDLIACLKGNGRNRFERELARARRYEMFTVLCEFNLSDLVSGKYQSNMKPHSALQSILAFQVRYGTPFMFCETRSMAEYTCYWLLQKYLYEIEKRYKLATKTESTSQPGSQP